MEKLRKELNNTWSSATIHLSNRESHPSVVKGSFVVLVLVLDLSLACFNFAMLIIL